MIMLHIMMLLLLLLPLRSSGDVQFDGVNDNISSTATIGNFVSGTAFTMMLYIKSTGSDFTTTPCYEGDFIMGDSGPNTILVGRAGLAGETACGYTIDAGSTFYTIDGATNSMPAGWHHYTFRLSAGTLTLFVDGVSVGTRGSVGNLVAGELTSQVLRYGNAGGLPSNDRFTEIKTYNVAVSNEEILRLAKNRLRTYDRTAPTGYWTLDCPEGTAGLGPFRDFTVNNRTLTGSNGGSGLTCVGAEFLSHPWGIQ